MTPLKASILFVASFAAVAAANAQSGTTTAEVRAELDAARRSGDLVVPGEIGRKESELHPVRRPSDSRDTARTRGEVRSELAQAIRDGEIPFGEIGRTAFEMRPDLYPPRATSTLTRQEVKDELADAVRNGDVSQGEIGMTMRERFPQRYAGNRSVPSAAELAASAPSSSRNAARVQ